MVPHQILKYYQRDELGYAKPLSWLGITEGTYMANAIFNHDWINHMVIVNRCIQGNGTKDAPSDKFSEPSMLMTSKTRCSNYLTIHANDK